MNKLTVAVIIMLISFSALAQVVSEDIAVVQNMYGVEKRKLVSDYMKIPEEQAVEFWSLYDKYELERRQLGNERLKLIADYATNYSTLTDATADEIAKGLISNTIKYDKLHETYYSKFKKTTSALTAAKFLQLEVYLQSEIRSELQKKIPFIGEMELLQEKN